MHSCTLKQSSTYNCIIYVYGFCVCVCAVSGGSDREAVCLRCQAEVSRTVCVQCQAEVSTRLCVCSVSGSEDEEVCVCLRCQWK